MEDDAEDYDAFRRRNIAEKEAKFAELFKDILETRDKIKSQDASREKRLMESEDDDSSVQKPRKRRRYDENDRKSWTPGTVVFEVKRKYNTRSRAKKMAESNSQDSQESQDSQSDEEEEVEEEQRRGGRKRRVFKFNGVQKVLKAVYDPSTIPSPDEITPEQIENIAESSTGKVYCKFTGTSCHQCRQKTMDTKTVCRSGQCIGVRGQFCGPCLRLRYGEIAADVLKDPVWQCPACRGLCNCSICRNKNGQMPTGILAPIAQEEGFSSVLDYLQSAEGNEP